jgi:uncharacterized protein YceK
MAFRAIWVALLLSSLPTAGCGTVANLAKQGPEGGITPFGGVAQDVECLKEAKNGECDLWFHPQPGPGQHPQVALMLLCAADLPFSFIGDVLTWPYTATYVYINEPVPVPPVMQGPPPPPQAGTQATAQAPTPPGTQAPYPPGTQAPAQGRPQTPPLETLPVPQKLP